MRRVERDGGAPTCKGKGGETEGERERKRERDATKSRRW